MAAMKKRMALLALALVLSPGAVPALAAPEPVMEETVLADNDQVAVTVSSYDPEGEWGPTFEVLLENKTDRAAFFELRDVAVNGVMCDPFWAEAVPAGERVRSQISWYPEQMRSVGVNYVQTVTGELRALSGEADDDGVGGAGEEEIYAGQVSWSVDTGETDLPAVEPARFDHGFTPVEALAGDVSFTVADCDPAGSYDGGPRLVFYMENHTDRKVSFALEDVTVNGLACEPVWEDTVATAGAAAYGACEWWQDDLTQNGVDAARSDAGTARTLTRSDAVTLELAG